MELTRTLVALGLGLVLSACGSGPEAPPADRLPTEDVLVELHRAEEILVARCMADRGLPYVVQEGGGERLEGFRFRTVIDDPDWAVRYGYGSRSARRVAQAHESDVNAGYLETLSAPGRTRYLAALFGERPDDIAVTLPNGMRLTTSSTGCLSSARSALHGDLTRWFTSEATVANLPRDQRDPLRDEQYRSTVSAWAACMARAGHHYDTPAAVREALPRLDGLDRERAVAVAEATCAKSTGLGEIARRREAEHLSTLEQPYRDAVARHRALIHTATRK